jgi:hypothetical protein
MAGDALGIAQGSGIGPGNYQGFGAALQGTALIAQAVLCDPPWPTNMPNNAAALAGKIAILHRDATGGMQNHSHWAEQAGCIGELLVDQDVDATGTNAVGPLRLPGQFGTGTLVVTNPIVMCDYKTGTNLIAHATKDASSPVVLCFSGGTAGFGGEANYGRGASDTIFQVYVPQAGLYPMRLIWENAGGDLNSEWFTVDSTGTPTLINDPTSSVHAWISRTAPAAATLNKPTLGPNGVTVSWTGGAELQFAISVTGPWFTAPSQDNPQTIAPSTFGGMPAFFRVRSY